jgi:peptidoglycan/xylan/chitin deacetylase (PgdA/CDA1 family)
MQSRGLKAATLGVVLALSLTIVLSSCGSSTPSTTASRQPAAGASHKAGSGAAAHHASATLPRSTVTGTGTGTPGTASVPILMYHVINPPPAGAPYPGLYVPASEFAAQMQALKAAGWHAVTLDQLEAYWKRGVPLGPGKPIVLTFDNGYQSQYTNALPVLKQLGWVADENMQLTGLPPSQGGLTNQQITTLVADGWELDTQGISHAQLTSLDASELYDQVSVARHEIQQRFHVPVNWFCYPSGDYNATVIDAVKSAGFVGSTTVVPGWASPSTDPFTLPRLRVLGGTNPQQLLSEIDQIRDDPAAPASYNG